MEQLIEPIGHIGLRNADRAKDVILKLGCDSFGDSLCSTPTLRKLAKSYGKKIIVCSYKPFVFENNPYVDHHIHINDFKEELREQYEVLETFNLKPKGMPVKYGSVDIRRIHCTDLGFDLRPNEMHCEYYPGPINFKESDESFLNSESYIVIHISKTWPSRTWPKSNYENLITNINKAGYKVALIGFDTPREPNNYDKSCYNFDDFIFEGVSFLNRTSLDQDFEIIKKANICVTCDTGILHLAGCTDTEIIYIGGSIDPIFRAPYRHGGQDYKFSFVGGECKIFCGSDIKYCITEHAKVDSCPQISECLEKKPTFECHPTHGQVFKKIAEVNLRNMGEVVANLTPLEVEKNVDLKKVLVDFGSSALGDSLAWIPYVEEYRLKNNCKIYCSTFRNELYEKSYPEIDFIKPGDVVEGVCDVIKVGWEKDKETGELRPPLDIRQDNLQRTASFCLGLEDHEERKPKIYIEDKQKKIEGKYVCIATQSTNQAKYWNNEEGWGKTVEYLQSLGYKVVCVDKHRVFGLEEQWNSIPEGVIDKTGDLPLQEIITDLYNCDFFIGLTSGLSWLAWALNKEVIMISGFSGPKTEFYTPYRIINTQVCNSCFNKEEFNEGGIPWNWCPYHEGTEREFECTKKIAFEDVKKEIDRAINFVDLKKEGLLTFDGLTQNILRLGDKSNYLEGIREQWQEIFINRGYETLSSVEVGDVVLDIGANVGFFAAFAVWRGASKCYSIEPVPYNFKILTNWTKTSKDRDKFFLINKAISDKPLDETAIINGSKEDCRRIETIKLSDFFKKHPLENFDFIKIDCEGGEWSVLNNEKELDLLIKKTKKLAMELHLKLDAKTFDFSFDFSNEFINRGFDVRFTDLLGKDITNQILNNEKLADRNDILAHDYYDQIIFYAQKKRKKRKVLISFDSRALGDAIGWVPYVEKYRIKNNCKVYCSTHKNELFKQSYPEINFIEVEDLEEFDFEETIKVGFFSDTPADIKAKNTGLQNVASYYLGLEHEELKPKIDILDKQKKIEGRYVCIAVQSTAQAKYWNNKDGWNQIIKYLDTMGYKVVCIDKDRDFGIEGQYNHTPKGVMDKTGDFSLQERITDIYNCEFFIGLSSGLSWVAWALGKKVILISGFTKPSNEFSTPHRPINKGVCYGCWNEEAFDKSNWNWCPHHEGTERQFECSKNISFEMVKEEINKIIS